ncbi:MAG: protein translocase subunit SecD [Myxococcales bacterium]|nr:protein translocase subunit SecD [Myxococcales bacterium]
MNRALRVRIGAIAAAVLLFGFYAVANFVPAERRAESPLLPDHGLRLGLDLQGGIHWVLGVKLEVAIEHELEFLRGSLAERLADEGATGIELDVEDGRLIAAGAGAADAKLVRDWADDSGVLRFAGDDAGPLSFALTDAWQQEVRTRGMGQVLEVLRRRIGDPIRGIPDSVVTQQGDDRVLVQIPGGQIDRARARELLRVTGFLEFKLVLDAAQTEELLVGKYAGELPKDTEIAFERDKETRRVLGAYLVRDTPDLTGDYLQDARVGFDRQQRAIVQFQFNPAGGKIFQDLTGEHIGDRVAIVLDDQVYSAPAIRSRISTRGEITGRFTPQEAADLAVVLRAGSLAVPVEIEEERTVGPALGADSIQRGVRASILGLVLILFFCVGYYRMSGLYAGVALLANLLLLVGVMSMFEATLTLPGLAGVVLTVGMAVDANVIIFERIREELHAGKTPRAAVGTGFQKAFWTIMDANITTLITALVLFEYGTGPIKGFAVTLSIGVVTSVLAALVITRSMFMVYPGTRHIEALSI